MFIFRPIIVNIYNFLSGNLPSDFFSNQVISTSLDFFQWFGIIIFGFSCLLLISSTVESRAAGELVNYKMVFTNILKGFLLLTFSRALVVWSFVFARVVGISIVGNVAGNVAWSSVTVDNSASSGVLGVIEKAVGYDKLKMLGQVFAAQGNESLITLVMFIVTIVVFFQLLTLYGMYYVQIVTGYFYIADVMRGNLSAVEDWLRDIAASGITFMLEYIFYILGFAMMTAEGYTDLAKCAPGLVLIVSSPAIPTALKKWGYSHGSGSARGVVSGLGNAVSGTVSALTHI